MGKKSNKMGNVMFLVEKFVHKAAGKHDLQRHEILGLVDNYIRFHYPGANEEFQDGTEPFVYFGHISGVKRAIEKHNAVHDARRRKRRKRG